MPEGQGTLSSIRKDQRASFCDPATTVLTPTAANLLPQHAARAPAAADQRAQHQATAIAITEILSRKPITEQNHQTAVNGAKADNTGHRRTQAAA